MRHPLNQFDEPNRRQFVERCAATAFGLSVVPTASLQADDLKRTEARGNGFGQAKRVIVLQLLGGLSQIDSFDPKSGPTKGPGDAIATSADYQVTEYFPETAKIADRLCVIRSMSAEVGVHAPAQYVMRTAYTALGTIRHPSLGAWAQHYLGRSHPTMPASVCVNRRSDQGNGFFPSSYAPLAIGNPADGVRNVRALGGDRKLNSRVALLNRLDTDFRRKSNDRRVQAYNGYYDDALSLMGSRELAAFDLTQEPDAIRQTYGDSSFGQGCLLARRLVSSGVRFVEVAHDGWDFHKNLADDISEVAPVFDQAYSALINDLSRTGLLESTLVVVATEFGRKPDYAGGGRGHHPICFSTVLAGGGVQAGIVHGASDSAGQYVDGDKVSVGAFHATIGWAAGLPLETEAVSPGGRPFTVGDQEKPVLEILA